MWFCGFRCLTLLSALKLHSSLVFTTVVKSSDTRKYTNAASLFYDIASYARDGSTVVLRGISLVDNFVARGSVVFVVDSHLKTYQVRTTTRLPRRTNTKTTKTARTGVARKTESIARSRGSW